MIADHSRREAVLLLTSYIHSLCGVIAVCILLHFSYQINSFLDNYKPEDDTPSEMNDDNLNSTLVCKGKKRQNRSLHEVLITLQQEQMEAKREHEERNTMFFRQIMEKQCGADAEEKEIIGSFCQSCPNGLQERINKK